ncbi:MAG: integrase core domain-containing protein [Neisseriaceae bacterium]
MRATLTKYFRFYNMKRPHQSLGGLTPELVYYKTQ